MSSAYLNSAAEGRSSALPVKPYHRDTPQDAYDLNFCFPVKALESNGVRLEPLIPSLHAKPLYDRISVTPGNSVFRFFGVAIPTSLDEYLTLIEQAWRSQESACNYVIWDLSARSGEPRLAGSISYILGSRQHFSVEIGYVMILPEFHRTHVTTHACGLLMQYALDSPEAGGLGLRRVQWKAHSLNTPSVAAAKRLGYHEEGIMRYEWAIPEGKEGHQPEGLPQPGRPGRHNWTGSMCWDDWMQGGKREHVVGTLMGREVAVRD